MPTIKVAPGEDAGRGISTETLLRHMPIGTARKLQDKVDKNRDGEISASEIGELFRDLEEGEEKISHLRGALVLAVIFLGASIAANLGTSVYAAERARTTSTQPEPQASIVTTPPATMLTDKEGNVLRVDRSLDEAALTSQLPNAAFDELDYLRIEGPSGMISFKVLGWARYTEAASRCGSVVVLYTIAGHVQFDGVAMAFDEAVSGAFSRAGFKVSSARRGRRAESGGGYTLTGIVSVIGMFQFVSELDTSSLRCGDDIPQVTNNPFANATEVLLTEHKMYSCGATGSAAATAGRPPCPSGGDIVDILGVQYYKRLRVTHAKLIDGEWFSAAHTTIPEFPAGGTVVEVTNGKDATAVYAMDGNGNCSFHRELESAPPKAFTAGSSNASDFTMKFVGYDVINGVYVRHYKLVLEGFKEQLAAAAAAATTDPTAANVTLEREAGQQAMATEISMFEHYDENRLYGLFVAAPSHLSTFESIVVNPTPDQIVGAGLAGFAFPAAGSIAASFVTAPIGCLSVTESFAADKVDLASYNSGWPYTEEHALAEIQRRHDAAAKVITEKAEFAALATKAIGAETNTTEASRRLLARRKRGTVVTVSTYPSGNAANSVALKGGNNDNARRLNKCDGECDEDTQCGSRLHCFQRDNGEAIPGCHGAGGGKDWDYCYSRLDDTRITLSGGNNDNARNLGICVGECDADSQCRGNLRCFQRSKSESIPGCRGSGSKGWDYCYDPDGGLGPFTFTIKHQLEDGVFQRMHIQAAASTCLPGVCGDPKISLTGAADLILSELWTSCEVTLSVSIKFEVTAIGQKVTFEIVFGAGLQAPNKLKMFAGFSLSVGVVSVSPKFIAYWTPPLPLPRAPNEMEIEVELCAFWICGNVAIPLTPAALA